MKLSKNLNYLRPIKINNLFRVGNKIDDRGFLSNFGVSLIYCLVGVFVIYVIVFFLKII